MKQQLAEVLLEAMALYEYPCVVFDIRAEGARRLASMRDVERVIGQQLLSRRRDRVRQGLANVVYWGNASAPYVKSRLKRFLSDLTWDQVESGARAFPKITGPGLLALKALGLPVFSNMSFLSKLRMFLDPHHYVVLDLRLAKLRDAYPETLFSPLSVQKTYIPCTVSNEGVYARWSALCSRWGECLGCPAADVERAVFVLAEENPERAAKIVASMQRGGC